MRMAICNGPERCDESGEGRRSRACRLLLPRAASGARCCAALRVCGPVWGLNTLYLCLPLCSCEQPCALQEHVFTVGDMQSAHFPSTSMHSAEIFHVPSLQAAPAQTAYSRAAPPIPTDRSLQLSACETGAAVTARPHRRGLKSYVQACMVCTSACLLGDCSASNECAPLSTLPTVSACVLVTKDGQHARATRDRTRPWDCRWGAPPLRQMT